MSAIERHIPTIYRMRWGLFAIVAAAGLFQLYQAARDVKFKKATANFSATGSTLIPQGEQALRAGNFSKFLGQSREFVQTHKARYVSIYDLEGNCLFHSFFNPGADIPNQKKSVLGILAAKTRDGSEQVFEYQDSGPAELFFLYPVRKEGAVVGSLQIEIDADQVYKND